MPVLPVRPFGRFRKPRTSPNESQLQQDRGIRQSEQYYKNQLYPDNAIEQEAQMDADLAQGLRKKRGLRNVKISGPMN